MRRETRLWRERLRAAAGPALGLALFATALAILQRELGPAHVQEIWTQLRAIGSRALAGALVLTAFSYLALAGGEILAFRWIGHRLGNAHVALASFVASAFSHGLGLAFLGGSAMRYRILTAWGVAPAEIVRVIGFNFVSFWLGFLALGAVVLTSVPIALPAALHPLAGSRWIGIFFAGALAVYVAWAVLGPRRVRVGGVDVERPRLATTCAQIGLSSLDWTLAASAFFVLLPSTPGLGMARVLGVFVVAQLVGIVSHVPAGLGVFEGTAVLLLAPWLSPEAVLASALAYRIAYYVVPFGAAALLFAGFEATQRSRAARRTLAALARVSPSLIPRVFAVALFAGGLILLLSGATPVAQDRAALAHRLLPLPVLEASHLLASLVGIGLLLLARAIQQRVDAGYVLALAALGSGAAFSLLKGLDWEEAALLSALFLALLPCRRFFYRRSSLLAQSFTPGWTLGILLALLGTGGVVLLSFQSVAYSNALWWQFDFQADAPRALRALMGSAVLLASLALARLLRPARPTLGAPSTVDLEHALSIVRGASASSAHLALLGDKQLLFHESGAAFLMYGVVGRTWIAMGDPVGPPAPARELAWRFRELVDAHRGLTAFYEVGADNLPLYLDLGLSLHKLGEEARVRVSEFSLEGGGRRGLRQTLHRMRREGASFELVPVEEVPALLRELAAVSDAWLENKSTREKRFSLGCFDPAYLSRTPVAIVRRYGRIVAFANLWAPEAREECSLDLMRYDDAAPPSVMEYLFIELLLWARQQGYAWFNLGMAPLSGFEEHRLAPLWSRCGALLFRHGENLYNFRGLRSFKQKFDPVWEPRYLASPGGIALPLVLSQIAALISRGVTGVLTR